MRSLSATMGHRHRHRRPGPPPPRAHASFPVSLSSLSLFLFLFWFSCLCLGLGAAQPAAAAAPACPQVGQSYFLSTAGLSLAPGGWGANFYQGSPFTATQTLRITHLGLHSASAPAIRLGLYTDSGGRPGTLLAQTPSHTLSSGAYRAVQSSSPTPGTVLAGQQYWIVGIWSSPNTLYHSSGGGRLYHSNMAYPTAMPSSGLPGTVSSTAVHPGYYMAGTCVSGTCSGGTSCVACPSVPTSVCYPTNASGCGLQSNACGNSRACGTACGTDRSCSAMNPNTQPGTCTCDPVPASACYPTNGTGCGLQSNSCGNSRACGTACGTDRSCSAADPATQPGTCTCDAVPASVCMANGGKTCGRVSNACGNSQDCGLTNCGQDETCNATDPATSAGVCACDAVPASACTGLCGVITNACGASRDCGTGACVAGAVCNFLSNQCQFASGSPSSPPPSPSPSSPSGGTPATPSPGDGQAGGDEGAGGSGDGAFLWWYIVAAAAGCCCCILLVAAAIFFVRRRRGNDDDPSSSSDGIAMAATVGAPSGMGTPGATQGGEEHYGPIAATPVAGSIYARFDASSIGASVGGPGSGSLSPGGGGGAKGPSVDPAQLQKGEELGRGEYGVVYKGTYQGEEVAIKHMIKDYDASALREFYAEAELMGKIGEHPNVLRFIGLALTTEGGGGNGAGAAIVTEFCAGSSLLNAILATPLEEDTLWFVVRGMAAGMAHLAASHVTHRDLACRNVLLGADWTPKICDFGMSRLTDAGSTQATTKTDTGPIKWMAPEALEHRQYSEKSDVWMFGATVNETVSRKEPHPDKTAMEVGTQIILRRLQPVAVDGTPAAMVPVVNACFAFEPADRPTFAEIVDQLG